MALVVDNSTLARAALAVHDVLERNSLAHVFLGGFELVLLGNTRGTKDIDVEVAKPFIRGFQKVREAFEADEAFLVFNGTTEEGIRAIWGRAVGVDILMRGGGRFPRSTMNLTIGPPLPFGRTQPTLPFLTPTHLLIEKVRCAGERLKVVDVIDILFIYDTLAVRNSRIDLSKVRRRLTEDEIARARSNHPEIGRVLDAIAVA